MPKPNRKNKFAVCISNEGCDDLEVWKLYKVLPDRSAGAENYLRVIDESGEDYLYPEQLFVLVEFPPPVRKRLIAAAVT